MFTKTETEKTVAYQKSLFAKFPFLFAIKSQWTLGLKGLITIKNITAGVYNTHFQSGGSKEMVWGYIEEARANVNLNDATIPKFWVVKETATGITVDKFDFDRHLSSQNLFEVNFESGTKIGFLVIQDDVKTTHIVIKTDDDCYVIYNIKF